MISGTIGPPCRFFGRSGRSVVAEGGHRRTSGISLCAICGARFARQMMSWTAEIMLAYRRGHAIPNAGRAHSPWRATQHAGMESDDHAIALRPRARAQAAIRAGVPEMIPYSLRHYCNSRSMSVPPDVRPDREERATWMGHHDPRHAQTYTYEHHDPDYLERARKATDAFMLALDHLSRKSLFAPGTVRRGLHVVERRAER